MSRMTFRWDALIVLLLTYCTASLFHFVHNAMFIDDYPNLPVWLSASNVYAAWLAIASVGLSGWILMRLGFRVVGLLVIAVYAGLGFDGLGHYYLAPFSAHSLTMNLSILSEVLAAACLMILVAKRLAEALLAKMKPELDF